MLQRQCATRWPRVLTRVLVVSGLLLTPVEGFADHKEEVRVTRASLDEARQTLFGQGAEAGLITRGRPFEAKFDRMALGSQEAASLMLLISEVTKLPPRSEVKLEGAIDKMPFKARIQKDRKGRVEVKIEGLTFTDQQELLGVLGALAQQGVWEAQLRGIVEGKRVEVSLER
jgi:hypothetical protein